MDVDLRTGRATLLERLMAVGFTAALLVPGMAMVAGVRPPELENAAPATLPPIAGSDWLDPRTYAAVDAFVGDSFPGRERALRVYAALDYGLLGGSTTPQVILGVGDWLFFRGELIPRCPGTADGLLADIDAVAAVAAADGIDFWMMASPDKHVVYPERVATSPALPAACTDLHRDAVRAGFALRPDTTVDLWAPVLEAKARGATDLYYSQDSHWTPDGAMPAIEALVEALAPGTWAPSEITRAGTMTYSMELARLMGRPTRATVPRYVVRPEVEVMTDTIPVDTKLSNAREIGDYRVVGTDRFVPGTTMFVHDSFFAINRQRIVPWFEHSIWVHVDDLRDNPKLLMELPRPDRIVVQRTERLLYTLDLRRMFEFLPLIDTDPVGP